MARFFKQGFNRQGKRLARKLIFIGQYEPEIESSGFSLDAGVEIVVEGETAAFVLALTWEETKKIRRYLDKMGY